MSTKVLLLRGEAMSLGAQAETLWLVSGHWSIPGLGLSCWACWPLFVFSS